MTLAELRVEVKSRLNGPGYRFLSDDRVDRFINDARSQLDRMFLWPYREASVTGIAPLAISDLDQVEAVINTTLSDYPLSKADYRSLLDWFGDLSAAGSPSYYYLASPSGTPEVATYPVSSDVIGVQYWKITADLVSDSDTPAAPSEFHGIIADLATTNALRANRLHNEADAYMGAINSRIQQMLTTLTPGQRDGPDAFVGVTGASSDW